MLQKVNFNVKTCHDVLEECVKSQGCRETCKSLWASQQEAQLEQAPPLGHGKRLGHTAHPLPSLSTFVNETLNFQPFPPTCKQCNKSGIKPHVWSQESNSVTWIKVKVSAVSREAEQSRFWRQGNCSFQAHWSRSCSLLKPRGFIPLQSHTARLLQFPLPRSYQQRGWMRVATRHIHAENTDKAGCANQPREQCCCWHFR